MTSQLFAIAIGGALGAVSRFGVQSFVYRYFNLSFPLGTLIVNALGSLLIGFILSYFLAKRETAEFVQHFMVIGFLGAFTTFSTFSIETLRLLQGQAYGLAFGNIVLSLVVCFGGCWLGFVLGRVLA